MIPRYQFQMLPYAFDGEDAFQGVLISILDISEIKERLKIHEKLNQKYENILYSVSHDLNGPIANIQQLVHEMENVVEMDKENTLIFDLLNLSVLKLKNSISELVEANKRNGIAYNQPDKINFTNLMDEVELRLHDKIEKTDAKITRGFHVMEVMAYKMNIRSILYNLLSNAIKFNSPDRKPEITVRSTISGDQVILAVEDNGIGLREDMKDMIFSKFGRYHTGEEGTGMGLFIVKKMIEDMGGTVEVESTYGKGSIFIMYFKNGKS
ncbi:MAG: HAMP domain-containing sensor histidine kinase [Cyclobacteriaceae bacterium]